MSAEGLTYVLLGFVRRDKAQELVDSVYERIRRDDIPLIGIHEDIHLLVAGLEIPDSRRTSSEEDK